MIPALLVALGAASVVWGLFQAYRVHRARNWPTVHATVRNAAEEEHSALMGTIEQPHSVALRYLYEVDGRLYTGNRVYFGDTLVRPGLRSRIATLAPGTVLALRVNPRDPGDAVVEPRLHPVVPRVTASGVALMLLGPALIWLERSQVLRGGVHDDYVAVLAVGLALAWIRASERVSSPNPHEPA